jgi:FSR family fosmidomycin resistance protein-like MFS transporter
VTIRTQQKTVLYAFMGAHVINDLYSTILPAFLPAVADEFDLDYTELGVLSFAFIVLTGILQPVLGSVADRYGRRRWILTFGFLIASVGFIAMAVAPTFLFIVIVSLLVGLGGATYHPQATAFIVQAYPDTRGRALGLHGWAGSAGHFLAPAVAVLAVWAFDWRIAMALIAIPTLVTAVVLRSRVEETKPTSAARLLGAITPQLLLVSFSFGMVATVGRSFITFFVKMLVDEGWAETSAGLLLTLILLGGAVAQPVGGRAFDRYGGRAVFVVGSAVSAAFIVLFAVSDGALSLIAIGGIAFFQFAMFPVSLAQASQLAPPEQTGAAVGVVFGISGLMVAAAQPLVGALGEAVGDIREALAWQLPLALLGLALATRIRPSAPTSMSQGDPEPPPPIDDPPVPADR